jgi:putative hemolysin
MYQEHVAPVATSNAVPASRLRSPQRECEGSEAIVATANQAEPVFTIRSGTGMIPGRYLRHGVARLVDGLTGLGRLQQLYRRAARRPEPHFVDRALGALGITYDIEGDADGVPCTGPLVLVANHPRGAVDGLVLLSIALSRRTDVRVLGNELLARIPEMIDWLVPVDVRDGTRAPAVNARALRDALRHLRRGGCLCVFPAGEVASGGWGNQAVEATWETTAIRLARRAGAMTVPVRLDGSIGVAFRLAGLVHPLLRLALLPRVLLGQRGTHVRVRVAQPVSPGCLPADDQRATRDLQVGAPASPAAVQAPAVHTADPVLRDVTPLLESQALVSQGEFTVFWTRGAAAPALLECVGRAREIAFRAVGEGTGQDVDLDAFDGTYRHLCLWDRRTDALAGAYRMGLADEIAAAGSRLYTQTLFDYDERFLDALGPALELGRAFLSAPYQRQFAPLALLWAAIGRFVAARPQYRTLFGAVSIDIAYGPAARHAMVSYLQQHASAPALTPLVAPSRPLTSDVLTDARLAWAGTFPSPDVTALDAVVSRLDGQGRGVPVLLRQYLKLDARAVAFSIDPAFSHVLDTMIVVNLPTVAPALLRRFMGSGAADGYLRHHSAVPYAAATPSRRRA